MLTYKEIGRPLNRTMVELKCVEGLFSYLPIKTLNRTMVELKWAEQSARPTVRLPLNRTMVELKCPGMVLVNLP